MFHRIYIGLEGSFVLFFGFCLVRSLGLGFGLGLIFVSDIHWRYSFSLLGFQCFVEL